MAAIEWRELTFLVLFVASSMFIEYATFDNLAKSC